MMPFADLFPEIIPWLFLIITMTTAFVKPKFWTLGLLFTLVSGLLLNAINIMGLGIITMLFSLAFYANKSANTRYVKYIITSIVFIICIALAAHLLPGFNNFLVLNDVEKSINSVPFTLYLNFDKPMIFFALLILYPTVLMNNKALFFVPFGKEIHKKLQLIFVVVLGFILILALASLFSLINFEPELPSWWWLFALNNLLLTCVIEEVFFRGVIQQKLTQLFSPFIGLVITSFLFGIAHFTGGIYYIFVASLAGLLYGYVYLNTGKIWCAVLIHFSLNMLHLYCFTYPLAKT